MFNKVILVGNLTRDIELRYSQSGSAIAKTGIATNRRFKSQTGEQKEEVCFVDITFFGRSGEIANQYLRKGSKILVEGRLQFEQWTDQTGQKRSKHSVIVESMQMLDSKGSNPSAEYGTPMGMAQDAQPQMGAPTMQQGQPQQYQAPQSQSQPYQQQQMQQPQQAVQQSQQMPNATQIPEIDIDEDEIPF